MNIGIESQPAVRPVFDARDPFDGDTVADCDWCGRTVHRETAVGRADGDEIVLLCPECESGAD
jgi:hypothetical protein